MPDAEERRHTRRDDTTDPHRSRLRALKILYQADLRDEAPDRLLARIVEDPDAQSLLDDLDSGPVRASAHLDDFARTLVVGVADHHDEIDDLLETFSRRWPVHRMPAIDRNVLRLAVYELLHEQTSSAVVIDEAVEIAKELSTDDSHRFVNGVLEAIRQSLLA